MTHFFLISEEKGFDGPVSSSDQFEAEFRPRVLCSFVAGKGSVCFWSSMNYMLSRIKSFKILMADVAITVPGPNMDFTPA